MRHPDARAKTGRRVRSTMRKERQMKIPYMTVPISARCVFGKGFVLTLVLFAGIMMFAARPGVAQQRAADEVTVKQVASDLYFFSISMGPTRCFSSPTRAYS